MLISNIVTFLKKHAQFHIDLNFDSIKRLHKLERERFLVCQQKLKFNSENSPKGKWQNE